MLSWSRLLYHRGAPRLCTKQLCQLRTYTASKERQLEWGLNKVLNSSSCFGTRLTLSYSRSALLKPRLTLLVQSFSDDRTPAADVSNQALGEEDLKVLAGEDDELVKKLKLIEFEYLVYQQEGARVPSKLRLEDWRQLMQKPSKTSRQRYLSFLWLKEIKKANEKLKKEKRKQELQEEKEQQKLSEVDDGHLKYGLWNNTIFLKVLDTTINHFYHSKIVNAMNFDNPVIFDLGYDKHLNTREQNNVAAQLTYMFAENREHPQPFHFYFCNTNFESEIYRRLLSQIPIITEPDFPLNITHQSYLDLFPKEKLVYLTPHCRTEMTHFDPDLMYIIGGIVDLCSGEPLSLAKAKREGIAMLKFPLDRYLHWGSAGKSLTLNQTVNILRELRHTDGDWERALQFVPRRKLKTTEQVQAEIISQRVNLLLNSFSTSVQFDFLPQYKILEQ